MEKSEKPLGKLYLIPSLMGDVEPLEVLPLAAKKVLDLCDHYIVENEKSARAFIKRVFPSKNQVDLILYTTNKFSDPNEYPTYLEAARRGEHIGLISEAGAPGIADPGSELITLAHKEGIRVVPLVGPSSIFMAMMASGMNGQNFAFTGYLPLDAQERKKKIKFSENGANPNLYGNALSQRKAAQRFNCYLSSRNPFMCGTRNFLSRRIHTNGIH
jgi:16S rRNA (cytidine1402-2'-O)-methyltransferase